MSEATHSDVIVAGTGPAGLAGALALARAGFSVRLIGPQPDDRDRRTTALMMPAIRFLRSLGLDGLLAKSAAPLRTMRIVDATGRLIRSPTVTFHAAEIGEESFGYNMPNVALSAALAAAVSDEPSVAWTRAMAASWTTEPGRAVVVTTTAGDTFSALLVAAADGRESPARDAAGIRSMRHRLPQSALVLNFSHARDHGFVSTEFHTETGPFTQVPLPGRRSSLVWVVRPETAQELLAASDDAISRGVEDGMQSMLGRVEVEPGRQVFPLSASLPATFARNRVALLGEAAHVFPPIGAQGLNLGLRDVRDLVDVLTAHPGDPGADDVLAAYTRRRRPDIVARAGAVDALNRSLLSDLLPAQMLRAAGLGLMSAVTPLRAFVMREGMEPGSGFSALGKQVRRKHAAADQVE